MHSPIILLFTQTLQALFVLLYLGLLILRFIFRRKQLDQLLSNGAESESRPASVPGQLKRSILAVVWLVFPRG